MALHLLIIFSRQDNVNVLYIYPLTCSIQKFIHKFY